jgi:hypothetical protein
MFGLDFPLADGIADVRLSQIAAIAMPNTQIPPNPANNPRQEGFSRP